MKTSNKILLITLMIILSLTVIIIAGIGIFISHNVFPLQKIAKSSGEIISREFIPGDFNAINGGGSWELEIIRADCHKVIVTAPEYIINYIKPEVFGKTLRINQWFFSDPRVVPLKARIFMPELTGIESGGFSEIYFSGFKINRLKLKASETSRITGGNSNIDHFTGIGSGSAQIDLSSCQTVNAEFDLAFSSQMTLNMAGGRLKGSAGGSSMFIYSGSVAEAENDNYRTVKVRKKNTRE